MLSLSQSVFSNTLWKARCSLLMEILYITESLKNYLIFFLFFALIELLIVELFYKKNRVSVHKGFLAGWQLLACLITAILTITGTAGINEVIKNGTQLIRMGDVNLAPFFLGSIEPFGLVMNVLLFVPLGIGLPLLFLNCSFKQTVLAGFILSLLIELGQLFNFRATDINDLLMNTLGVAAGFGIYRLLLKKCHLLQIKNGKNKSFFVRNSAFANVILMYLFYFFIGSPVLNLVWRIIYGY